MANDKTEYLKPISMYVTDDEKAIIYALAKREHRSISNLCKTLVIKQATDMGLVTPHGKLREEFLYLLEEE